MVIRFKEFAVNPVYLDEAVAKSGYNDEHATAHLWNKIVSHPNAAHFLKHPDNIRAEIEKAKKDKNHFLNVKDAPSEGFKGGVKNAAAVAGYYHELHHAAATVYALAKHPSFKQAVKRKLKARVAGGQKIKRDNLSPTWQHAGAKDGTSKADIEIGERDTEHFHPISLKKGDSQLMSAQPEEFHATYEHATSQHMKDNPKFKEHHKRAVMERVMQISKHLKAMAGARPEKQRMHRDKAQELINSIHEEHPDLIHQVAFEAATGHGKFGHGQPGTARHLVTSLGTGAHIHDTKTGQEPIQVGVPRIALPKGTGRPGNVKLDYSAE